MFPQLKNSVTKWYKESPQRAVSINLLMEKFKREKGKNISYTYFLNITKEVTKVQSIKTGGYYINFENFIDMLISRSINNVNYKNTICIDEKPFSPKKYSNKNIRVHTSFKGKSTAKLLRAPNPLKNIIPHYLLAAISNNQVILYHISTNPIDSEVFNNFIFKLADKYQTNQDKTFFLFDNATFHQLNDATQSKLSEKKIFITKTAPLGSFSNPIEEFFSLVHFYFKRFLSQRILLSDSYLSNDEYASLIKKSVNKASQTCNYRAIYARAGLL